MEECKFDDISFVSFVYFLLFCILLDLFTHLSKA